MQKKTTKKIKPVQFTVSIIKNIFIFMRTEWYKFLFLLFMLAGIITWLIIIFTAEEIEIGKDGLNIKKEPIDPVHVLQRKGK